MCEISGKKQRRLSVEYWKGFYIRQSSKLKGQREALARMLAIGLQRDTLTTRRSQIFGSQHKNKEYRD